MRRRCAHGRPASPAMAAGVAGWELPPCDTASATARRQPPEAVVELESDGRVRLFIGSIDMGQGTDYRVGAHRRRRAGVAARSGVGGERRHRCHARYRRLLGQQGDLHRWQCGEGRRGPAQGGHPFHGVRTAGNILRESGTEGRTGGATAGRPACPARRFRWPRWRGRGCRRGFPCGSREPSILSRCATH